MHICNRNDRWEEYDARGIFLCFVCEICHESKMSKYRPDVLTDTSYWADEPISAGFPEEEY